MISKISNYKFIIPPIVAIFFVGIANPDESLKFIKQFDGSLITLASSVVVIFTLGFIISNITYFIFNITGWNYFEKLYGKEGVLNELAEWKLLASTKKSIRKKYIRGKIEKRWNIAVANANCVTGLLIAGIFVISSPLLSSVSNDFFIYFWMVVLPIISFLFGYNSWRARKDIKEIENEIKNVNPSQNEKKSLISSIFFGDMRLSKEMIISIILIILVILGGAVFWVFKRPEKQPSPITKKENMELISSAFENN